MRDRWNGAPWLEAVARVFDQAGAPLYIVGGAVRNPLMGLPISDVDVCGPTLPEEICAFCEGTEVRTFLRAPQFGTVELHVTDENGCPQMAEYTAWREDCYQNGHKPDSVTFTTNIAVDARRRDFSVNAMYQRVRSYGLEDVTDPTGGLAHLKQGILHTATENPDDVLRNDGLRILRGARFQAELGLSLDEEHLASMKRHAHLVDELAPSRMREETEKILMADSRYPELKRSFPATESGLKTLETIGVWNTLFAGVPYDETAVCALKKLPFLSLPVRMALLCRSAETAAAETMMKLLNFPARDISQTLSILRAARCAHAPLVELAKLGWEALEAAQSVLTALEDPAAMTLAQALRILSDKPMGLKELAVNGTDLKPLFEQAGIPLRALGGLLEALWSDVLENHVENSREKLLKRCMDLIGNFQSGT